MDNIIWTKTTGKGNLVELRHHLGTIEVYMDGKRQGFTRVNAALRKHPTASVYQLCSTKICATEEEAKDLRVILDALPKAQSTFKKAVNPEWKRYNDAMNEGGDGYNPHAKYI